MTLYLGNNLVSGVATPTEPTRNLGQIIESIVPLTDAGLHLLDGALINGSGIYSAFVDAIADLVTDYPDLFETEANWQSAVTTYGVCGKFVYDSVNNTVRLPKITGIIEGTTDVSALGDLIEAGLPNIEGTVASPRQTNAGTVYEGTGAFTSSYPEGASNGFYYGTSTSYYAKYTLNASLSNPIYGNSSTVQPQTIKILYYIVIATSTKTEIQVDIDEIATDLNGKADTDLTNVTNSAKVMMSGMGMPSNKYIDLTLGASGTEYTAPADGYVMFRKNNNINGYAFFAMYVNDWLYSTQQDTTVQDVDLGNILPVKKGDKFSVYYNLGGVTRQFRFIYAVGSESEAS